MFIYPNVLFNNKQINKVGTVVSLLLVIGLTVTTLIKPLIYSTEILSVVDDKNITNEYNASLADNKYGDVFVELSELGDSYVVHADFKKRGRTELIINTPDGITKRYNLVIELFSYELNEK